MGYGRLGPEPSDPGGCSTSTNDQPEYATSSSHHSSSRRKKVILLSLLSLALIIASAVSATLLIGIRTKALGGTGPSVRRKPTQAISKTCSKTRYPSLCVNSLLDFPGSVTATEQDLVHISFNMTLQHLSKALYLSSSISNIQMDPRVRSAYDDCLELLDDSIDSLTSSLFSVAPPQQQVPTAVGGSTQDVLTWLSASLTNQGTCSEGFADINGAVKDQMADRLKDLSELVSNCLAIFSASTSDDFSGVPIQNKRRLMDADLSDENENADMFPSWVGRKERKLLSLPVSEIQADIIVSKDGNGTYKTITEAIKNAPEHSKRRIIIYVRAGR